MNTQDNNKPSRLSLALLFVICAVLTVPAVLVFLQLNSEPVTKPGRVLGFYIEGVLGSPGGAAPNLLPPPDPDYDFPETMGWPVPIRKDGTVSLPSLKPVYVQDKSLKEIRELVRSAYKNIIPNQNIAIRIRLPLHAYDSENRATMDVNGYGKVLPNGCRNRLHPRTGWITDRCLLGSHGYSLPPQTQRLTLQSASCRNRI